MLKTRQIYDNSVILALVNILSLVLKSGTETHALIAATVRNERTLDLFLRELKTAGLRSEIVHTDSSIGRHFTAGYSSEGGEVRIYKIF